MYTAVMSPRASIFLTRWAGLIESLYFIAALMVGMYLSVPVCVVMVAAGFIAWICISNAIEKQQDPEGYARRKAVADADRAGEYWEG